MKGSGKVFKHTVRVPYADIDKMGFVYYANYFVYFEMARARIEKAQHEHAQLELAI